MKAIDPKQASAAAAPVAPPEVAAAAAAAPATGPTAAEDAAVNQAVGAPVPAGELALQEVGPIGTYPGDKASQAELAKWLASEAKKAGLPPELPVMASLVESGVKNLKGGDADSAGFFQMRVGIWDQGPYKGYRTDPQLQAKWFIDNALDVKKAAARRGQVGHRPGLVRRVDRRRRAPRGPVPLQVPAAPRRGAQAAGLSRSPRRRAQTPAAARLRALALADAAGAAATAAAATAAAAGRRGGRGRRRGRGRGIARGRRRARARARCRRPCWARWARRCPVRPSSGSSSTSSSSSSPARTSAAAARPTPAMLTEIGADASSTGVVPSAAFAVPPPSPEPPVALPMPKATANATTTAASVIPI